MSHQLRQGWRITKQHFKINVLLFLYQALWGFLLFRTIDQITSPLLLRYPSVSNSAEALQMFWIEIEFQLLKTDILLPYIISFILLLVLRMLITPIWQSGIFYSAHAMCGGEQRSNFRKGIRTCWKPMMLLYWIKSLLIIAPLLWILSPLMKEENKAVALQAVLGTSPWIWAVFLLWAALVTIVGYMIQLGIGAEQPLLKATTGSLKHIGKVVLLGIIIVALYGVISLSIHALSILWVTFISFLLYQLLPFIRSTCDIWLVSSQYSAIKS